MRFSATLSWVTPALALALGATAQAHESDKSETAKAPVARTSSTTTASSMIVVRDKETGRLRAPTPEEAERLIASGRAAQAGRAPVEPYEIRARPGQRAMALGDHGMSHQMARKNAQGGVDEVCVTGEENVSKAFSAAKGKAHE